MTGAYSDRVTQGPLAPGTCVEDVDFAQSMSTTPADAMKGEAFEQDSVSMHTMLTYSAWPPRMQPHVTPSVHGESRMSVFFGLSDDASHCCHYCHENQKVSTQMHHDWRRQQGMAPMDHKITISDGGSHYSSRNNWWIQSDGRDKYRDQNVQNAPPP